nr:MAG TPA: hypothetical protein [Caudoviricetes sp.]
MQAVSASWYNKGGNKGQLCYRHFCAKNRRFTTRLPAVFLLNPIKNYYF